MADLRDEVHHLGHAHHMRCTHPMVHTPTLTHTAPESTSAKPANGVDDVMREKGRRRVFAALSTNPSFAKRSNEEVQQHASSVEDGCFSTSQQR